MEAAWPPGSQAGPSLASTVLGSHRAGDSPSPAPHHPPTSFPVTTSWIISATPCLQDPPTLFLVISSLLLTSPELLASPELFCFGLAADQPAPAGLPCLPCSGLLFPPRTRGSRGRGRLSCQQADQHEGAAQLCGAETLPHAVGLEARDTVEAEVVLEKN